MSQDNKEKVEQTKSQMMKISLVALLIVLSFMIEMYEIITDPTNMIVIGALGGFLLVAVYVEMLFIGKLAEKKALDQEEAFDNVYRSEKASYLLMRKYFDQMEHKMENLGDISNIPYKELIAAQKALAKAQINRNKQNTNALLISNDRMMQRLTSIQKDITDILTNTNANENAGINEINTGLSEQDKSVFLEGNNEVLQKQQEILHNLKELESSLRNEILESANKVASMKSQQISVPQPQMQIQENEDMIPPLDIEEEFSFTDASDDQERRPSFENSSESNLDRLLQQMNISDSLESELQPIIEEPELQPIAEEPELQPILETPELQPIMEESGLQPILEEPELQPIAEEPELQLILEEPELQPIAEESELQPIIEEQELQPIAEEPELQSIIEEPEQQPILEDPELRPIETPEQQVDVEESESIIEPELELLPIENMQLNEVEVPENKVMDLMSEQMESGPTAVEPEIQSQLEEPELELITAVSESVMEQPELQPQIEEPVIEKAVLDPAEESRRQLQSIAEKFQPRTKSALESYRTKSVFQSMQKEADHGSMKAEASQVHNESNRSNEKTTDKLSSMAANLESAPVTAEPSKPVIQPDKSQSSDQELENIMKALDIDDVSGDSLEDLDIDKILEVPLSTDRQDGAGSAQVMSSEEIAALIANTELLSEPEIEKNDDMMDLSDPSHVMSSDEIAALIANM